MCVTPDATDVVRSLDTEFRCLAKLKIRHTWVATTHTGALKYEFNKMHLWTDKLTLFEHVIDVDVLLLSQKIRFRWDILMPIAEYFG